MTQEIQPTYFERIENGENVISVFQRHGYVKCLEHFLESFEDMSGIVFMPQNYIAFYSNAGNYLAIDTTAGVVNRLSIGTDTCKALNNDLSMVSWMVNAFAEYLKYNTSKDIVTIGSVRKEWYPSN